MAFAWPGIVVTHFCSHAGASWSENGRNCRRPLDFVQASSEERRPEVAGSLADHILADQQAVTRRRPRFGRSLSGDERYRATRREPALRCRI